jgi:hypothetical protein
VNPLPRVAAFAALAMLPSAALAQPLTYNPALGTVPSAQGWTFAGSFSAPTTVAAGTLTYGPTTVGGTTYWAHDLTQPLLFSTETAYLEATIRLSGADFGNFSGYRRAGFSLYLRDDAGRWIIADIGDNRASIGNDDFRTGDPVATVDFTSAFRTVRLEAGPTGARLLVDGSQILTLALGSGAAASASARWGEATVLANANQTEVRWAAFVPAPAPAALAGLALLAAARRRR